MTRRFTRILAAVALLVFMTPSLVAWGQTYSLTPNATQTGLTNTSYITNLTEFTYNSVSWKMNQWNPSNLQVRTNQSSAASEFRFYNTSAFTGKITQVVISFSTLNVTDASKLMFLGGTEQVTATTGGTAGTWNNTTKTLTWTPDASANYTYFAFYQNGKAASGNNFLASADAIVVTFETGGTPTCAVPTFNPAAGMVASGTKVSISSTEGATIYYTTNGDAPTTNSSVYSTPIEITSATTIKAFATKNGFNSSEIATAAYTIMTPVSGYTIDFESDLSCYVDWEFTNVCRREAITAHGDNYYASNTNESGNATTTAIFKTKEKVAYPDKLTCYLSKEGTNTNANSKWYVQVSLDGEEWEEINNHAAAAGITSGEWTEFSGDIKASGYTNVYVRLYYSGTNAIRAVDDISLTTYTPAAVEEPVITVTSPFTISTSVSISCITEGATIYYTTDGNDPTTNSSVYSEPFTINSTTTIKAKAVKDSDESTIAEVTATKDLATPTVEISSLNIDVNGTATVNTNGPALTLTTSDANVASVSGTTVTGVAAGTATITASWSANNDYSAGTKDFTVVVTDPNAPGTQNNPYTVAQALAANPATGVYVRGIISTITEVSTQYGNATYNISDDGTTSVEMIVYRGKYLDGANFTSADQIQLGDEVVVTGELKLYLGANQLTTGNHIVSIQHPANTDPSITVNSATVSVNSEEHDGTLDFTYENLTITAMTDFAIQYYDAEGEETTQPDWIEVLVAEQDPEIGEGYVVSYYMVENEGEARTAYFKVYAMDDETNLVYSNLVTISQAAPVHNYAELPFEWNYFSSTPVGITNYGVSTGGNNFDYLKFDNAGDYIILHFNEQPGILTFDIKGNTNGQDLWEGEFKVQTSEDGETYTDIRYYSTDDELPTSFYSDQTIATLNKNVRYIKWIYVTKTKGNIAIDNINLAKPVIETIGYPFTNNQWYLIASPVGDVAPADVDNMTTGSYALYRFYQQGDADGKEWINYKNSTGGGFELKYGNGYLYANQNAGTLTFTGATIPYMDDSSNVLPLEYDEGADFAGYNLLGNPFNQTVWTDWDIYVMDEDNNNIIPSNSRSIAPMQGFFVIAPDEDCTVTLYDNEPEGGDKGASVALNVSRNRGNVIDRAIVRMGEGRQLPKFQLFEGSTKVYIPQGDQDYAVVRSEGQGELPVNFRASENGTYTLSMDVENMDMNYLHLIDNMTGMDVDLLQTPSYTFEAKVNDYESRFRLVFAANNNNEDGPSTGSGTFAFYSNGNWIINNAGEATLQVVDLTGRILSSETVNGSVSKTISAVPGVYMLRLINGDNVNVQKIVVR